MLNSILSVLFPMEDSGVNPQMLRNQNYCRDPGSNRGPLDLQSNALPTELSRPVINCNPCRLFDISEENYEVPHLLSEFF